MNRYLNEGGHAVPVQFPTSRPSLNPEQIQQLTQTLVNNLTGEATLPEITTTAAPLEMPDAGISMRLTSDGAQDIAGFSGLRAGRFIFIHNVGIADISLLEDSLDEYGILTGVGTVVIASNHSALIQYDSVSQRWRLISFT